MYFNNQILYFLTSSIWHAYAVSMPPSFDRPSTEDKGHKEDHRSDCYVLDVRPTQSVKHNVVIVCGAYILKAVYENIRNTGNGNGFALTFRCSRCTRSVVVPFGDRSTTFYFSLVHAAD